MAPKTLALLALASVGSAAVHGAPDTAHKAIAPHEDSRPTLITVVAPVKLQSKTATPKKDSRPTLITIVAPAKPWSKTVTHQKEAGNGYLKGSPLYKKQEALEKKTAWEAMRTFDIKALWNLITWWAILQAFLSQLIYVLFIVLVAYFYQKNKPQLMEKAPGTIDARLSWKYGLFDTTDMFGEDLKICCWAWCCPFIRWADTMSNAKVAFHEKEEYGQGQTGLTFWKGLAICLVCICLGPITGYLSELVLLCICIYYRQKLRVIFNHSPGGASYCWDCLSIWCCTCCAFVQEAREVEKVRKPC